MSVTVTHDDMTVTTNTGSEADVRVSMGMPADGATHDDAGTVEDPSGRLDDAGTGEAERATRDTAETPDDHAAEPPVRKPKPRDNPQARISQEVERRKAVEARAAQLEAELQRLKTTPAAVKPAELAAARPKPKEDEVGSKYPSYADFIEDLADWKAEQRMAAVPAAGTLDQLVAAELDKRERQREHLTRVSAHQERMAVVAARTPDIQAKIEAADAAVTAAGLPQSPVLIQAILGSDRSGDLVEWLATHPTDYLQLAREALPLDVAAAPLVRQLLEARLGAGERSGSAPAAQESRAKPPIKPVGASPVTAVPDDGSDDEPFEKHFARENAKDRKAGRL